MRIRTFISKLHARTRAAPPEKLFLTISTIFCGLFVFLIPPLQGWDEATHFLRAYQVSEAKILPERFNGNQAGGLLPENIINMHDEFTNDLVLSAKSNLTRSVNPRVIGKYATTNSPGENKAHKQFEASAIYSPVAYFPSAVGIATARALHLPLVAYIYLARILTLAVFIVLIYSAIRLTPVGKWVIFVAALFPQTATLAVSMGSDGLIIGLAAMGVALYTKMLFQKQEIKPIQIYTMVGISVALALTKQPYILITFLTFFIPVQKFGSLKRYLKSSIGIAAAAVLIGGLWTLQIDDIAQNVHIYQRPGVSVEPAKQVEFILNNPFEYGLILVNRLITNNTNPVYLQLPGTVTWKGIIIPQWSIFLSYFALIIAFIAIRIEKNKNIGLNVKERFGPVVILMGILILIYTSLYVSFSVVGSRIIEGINGRYFIPLIFLLIPLFVTRRNNEPLILLNPSKLGAFFTIVSIVLLSVTTLTIIATNYIPDFI